MDNLEKIDRMVNDAVVLLKEFKTVIDNNDIYDIKKEDIMTDEETKLMIKRIDKSIKELS